MSLDNQNVFNLDVCTEQIFDIRRICSFQTLCRGNFIEAKTKQNDKLIVLCWIFTSKAITNTKFSKIVFIFIV